MIRKNNKGSGRISNHGGVRPLSASADCQGRSFVLVQTLTAGPGAATLAVNVGPDAVVDIEIK